MNESYQKIIAISLAVVAVATVSFTLLALQKLERITRSAERIEAKLDRLMEAGAPLGRAAVEKGSEALKKIDAEDPGKSATEGVKEVGAAAKKRLLEYIEKKEKEAPDKQAQKEVMP